MKNYVSLISDPDKFGRGHLTRQIELRQCLKLSSSDYRITSSYNELKLLKTLESSTLLLDISDRDIEPPQELLSKFKAVVAFDWIGKFIPDINFVIIKHPSKSYPYKDAFYIGFKYLMLRNLRSESESLELQGTNDYILLTLGFSVPTRAYVGALKKLRKDLRDKIIIASGTKIDIQNSDSIEILTNAPNFPKLILEARLVVCNGGSTLIEALYSGKSVLALPQNEQEANFYNSLLPFLRSDSIYKGAVNLEPSSAKNLDIDLFGAERIAQIVGKME